jgi:peptidyl-prolyl cis-trans isomerase C
VLLVISSAACKKQEAKPKNAPLPFEAASAAPQSEADLKVVLATIDGVPITVGEFQDRINKQSPFIRTRYSSIDQKKEFLESLVRFEVLALEAKEQGFDKNPDVVRTMKQVMIQKLMKDHLENGLTPDDISEEEMQAAYQESEAEFHKPEEVRVSAIIIGTKSAADKVAKEALGEKGSSNKGFRELVKQHSTDAESKVRGGDLRYFTSASTELPKPVIDAAFGLKKTGSVVGPIDGGNGNFYILKQTGHRKAIDKSFDEVKRQIQNRLYRDKRTKAQAEFVANLKKKAKIETFDDALSKVQIDMSGTQGDDHSAGGVPGGHGSHGAGHSHGPGTGEGHSHGPKGQAGAPKTPAPSPKTPKATP